MREILFRGKRLKDGQWETGLLSTIISVFFDENVYIIDQRTGRRTDVIPETIGQYTGLDDKNGKMIFEGDVVKCTDGADETNELNSDTGTGEVEWLKKWGFWNISNIENGLGDILHNGYVEVIGNIHDNPELMEEL